MEVRLGRRKKRTGNDGKEKLLLLSVRFTMNAVGCKQIQKVIMSMARAGGKGPGIDKIPIREIKDCLPAILSPLTSIINGNWTEWSPIRSVIIRVIRGRPICLNTSMITDRIGRHD